MIGKLAIGAFVGLGAIGAVQHLAGGGGASTNGVELVAGGRRAVCVRNARTPADQMRGLQGQRARAPMLFTFARPGVYTFWMRGTPVNLAIVWVRSGRDIGHAIGRANSSDTIRPPSAITSVLEYRAGRQPRDGVTVTVGRSCMVTV